MASEFTPRRIDLRRSLVPRRSRGKQQNKYSTLGTHSSTSKYNAIVMGNNLAALILTLPSLPIALQQHAATEAPHVRVFVRRQSGSRLARSCGAFAAVYEGWGNRPRVAVIAAAAPPPLVHGLSAPEISDFRGRESTDGAEATLATSGARRDAAYSRASGSASGFDGVSVEPDPNRFAVFAGHCRRVAPGGELAAHHSRQGARTIGTRANEASTGRRDEISEDSCRDSRPQCLGHGGWSPQPAAQAAHARAS